MSSQNQFIYIFFQRANWAKISFNLFTSQFLSKCVLFICIVCLPIVGGGVFSTLLANKGYSTPMLQLAILYLLLWVWICKYWKSSRILTLKDIGILSISGILDWHANFLVVKAYSYTTITSVMILMVFTVPSAVFLSVVFLKVRYRWVHYISSVISILAVVVIVIWDIFESKNDESASEIGIIFGDIFWIIGVFLLAATNVYQEWLLQNKQYKITEILAFQAPTGLFFSILESWMIGELSNIFSMHTSHVLPIILFFLSFALSNFVLYNFIPYFISIAGATLMNIGNLTASVYSMMFDIFLFNGTFKWFYIVGFIFQITSIVLFSMRDPIYLNAYGTG